MPYASSTKRSEHPRLIPIYFLDDECHKALCNTAMLVNAGITNADGTAGMTHASPGRGTCFPRARHLLPLRVSGKAPRGDMKLA